MMFLVLNVCILAVINRRRQFYKPRNFLKPLLLYDLIISFQDLAS